MPAQDKQNAKNTQKQASPRLGAKPERELDLERGPPFLLF
jgi:hypothetical protein